MLFLFLFVESLSRRSPQACGSDCPAVCAPACLPVCCVAPPPPIFHCAASVNQTYTDSVSVRWRSPPHCGGRKDCYYEIAINGHATVRYNPPTFNFDVLESYTVNNLKPDTTYLVSVSIHNGVSEQDPDNAKLRQCCIEVKTKEGSKL